MKKFKLYRFATKPELVPLGGERSWDEQAVRAAGFDPEDEDVVCCELTEEWEGHPAGSLVVTGCTIEGYPFAVECVTIKLYEDNAGGLTITYDGQTYPNVEHANCGFSDLCEILTGQMDGDLTPDPDAKISEHDKLIAYFEGGRIHFDTQPGVAGCRCLGIEED